MTLHRSSSRGRISSTPQPDSGQSSVVRNSHTLDSILAATATYACRITRRRYAGDTTASRWTTDFEQMRPKPSGGPVIEAFVAVFGSDRNLKCDEAGWSSKTCILSQLNGQRVGCVVVVEAYLFICWLVWTCVARILTLHVVEQNTRISTRISKCRQHVLRKTCSTQNTHCLACRLGLPPGSTHVITCSISPLCSNTCWHLLAR